MRPATPSQTIGPFFHVAMPSAGPGRLAPSGARSVMLEGRVLDGADEPVDDALVEVWDASSRGFARCNTDKDGSFSFIVADSPGPGDFLAMTVFARGLLRHLVTRCYLNGFGDAPDAALQSVPDERRHTLLAERGGDGYRFDIRLQGEQETVFFAF